MSRELRSDEEIHHMDGDRANNNIDNLELLTKSENRKKYPNVGYRPIDEETKRKIGEANKGKRLGRKASK